MFTVHEQNGSKSPRRLMEEKDIQAAILWSSDHAFRTELLHGLEKLHGGSAGATSISARTPNLDRNSVSLLSVSAQPAQFVISHLADTRNQESLTNGPIA